MKKAILTMTLILNISVFFSQKIHRSPDERKDFANVFWKRQHTLFDLITDKPIFPSKKNGELIYHIYYSSNEDPKPYEGTFTEEQLERHFYYKFKNKRTCKKFCRKRLKSLNKN